MASNWPAPNPPGLRAQVRRHSVALISLAVAVVALGYNTWRNETSEVQRNIRHAAFLALENIGAVQEVVDERHYYTELIQRGEREAESRLRGYAKVALIRDLTELMPSPAPEAGAELQTLWLEHFGALDDRNRGTGGPTEAAVEAERVLTQAISDTRAAVQQVVRELD